MSPSRSSALSAVLHENGAAVLESWLREQAAAPTFRPDLIGESELREQSRELLQLITEAASSGEPAGGMAWQPVRQFLTSLSGSRAAMGFTAVETATFVLSL
jgi:rsbT co-antagonist protein RsbR